MFASSVVVNTGLRGVPVYFPAFIAPTDSQAEIGPRTPSEAARSC